MEQKKVKGYGGRGWLLIIWIATAFLAYMVIGNYPLNILTKFGYGGTVAAEAQTYLSKVYTGASVIGLIVQALASTVIGRMKSIKKFGVIMGALSILDLIGLMFIPYSSLWVFVYAFGTVLSVMYGTCALSILVGQWFPTRKGGVMGIATMAFPIGNGLIALFAKLVAGKGVQVAFVPFLAIIVIGYVIGTITVPDFPETVGGYRDNNPNMTLEMARAMMEQDIENKKTTVWKMNHTLVTSDFWLLTIPAGLLLGASVGTMTQSEAIISAAGLGEIFDMIMVLIMVFGILGSVILGFLDDKLGTKKAMIIACVIMLIAGVLGLASELNGVVIIPALLCLALFMGASSNFTVSLAAQYWRREDFGTVFVGVNSIANLINAFGPAVVGIVMGKAAAAIEAGTSTRAAHVPVFVIISVLGAVSIVLCACFSAKHVKEKDDAYRTAAGKPLDDALVGRK